MPMTMLHLFSHEVLVSMLTVSGIAMVIGARKLAWLLIIGTIVLALLPALLPALSHALYALSLPLLILLTVVVAFVILFAVLRLLGNATIGRNATDNMVGILAADVVRGTTRSVFAVTWAVMRDFGRLLLRPFRR